MLKNNLKKNPLIGIIGGTGRFGSWFKGFFESQGLVVLVSGRSTELTALDIAKKCDIVIVCVPIPQTVSTIRSIRDSVRPDALLCDFTSIKEAPLKEMMKSKSGCGVTGIHPLFGPLVPVIARQVITFCSGRDNKWTEFLKNIFEKNGAIVIFTDAKKHDEQMAMMQALTHFVNITFARAIQKNKDLELLNLYSTPIFRLQSILAGRVLGASPELYADLEMGNSFFKKVAKSYSKEVSNFAAYIEKGDRNKFIHDFKEAASFMENFIPVAQAKAVELICLMDRQPIELKKHFGTIEFNKNSKLKIAYLGPEGTFSHQAVNNIFSKKSNSFPSATITKVFDEVMNEKVDFGVVPMENSKEGMIQETLDGLIKYPLRIVGSYKLPIHLCLLARTKNREDIKVIKSHAQPIAQSRNWLNKNFPNAELEVEQSSVKAILSSHDPSVAFVGSFEAAKRYNLEVLAENIEDKKNNVTEFYVVAKKDSPKLSKMLKAKKTLILLAVYERPGVLRDALNHFADKKISLTKLHSRISEAEGWDYYFFVEVEGQPQDEKIKQALKEIKQHCSIVRVLGVT